MITIWISKAILCVANVCHPVLVGEGTPTGTFPLVEIPSINSMAFAKTETGKYFAIHPAPSKRRLQLLQGDKRTGITAGCINVSDDVYAAIRGERQVRIVQ